MRKIIILLLTVLTISASSYGQTDKQTKAYELGMKAIEEMDAGNIKKAIKLFEQARALDPENIIYPYEISYGHYLDKNYKVAIKTLKEIINHPQANARIHQMLGNSYDMDGKPGKAVETYESALKIFPTSGLLYLERGTMELKKGEYDKALKYYEKGIQAEPKFPSNYYFAAKIFLNSAEKVWGMIYGEIFMNLERNSKRTAEMSKILYNTYQNQIQFSSDASYSVSFSKYNSISISSSSDQDNLKLPFGIGIYEPILALSIVGENNIDISSLNRIRTKFLNTYYRKKHNEDYPNILFDYQRQINEAGHYEAYNHWILMKGDKESFTTWHEVNKDKWDSFIAWFTVNPIKIDDTNKFYRDQYSRRPKR